MSGSRAIRCRRCGKVIGVADGERLTVKWSGRTVITYIYKETTIICDRCHYKNAVFIKNSTNPIDNG